MGAARRDLRTMRAAVICAVVLFAVTINAYDDSVDEVVPEAVEDRRFSADAQLQGVGLHTGLNKGKNPGKSKGKSKGKSAEADAILGKLGGSLKAQVMKRMQENAQKTTAAAGSMSRDANALSKAVGGVGKRSGHGMSMGKTK